MKRSAFFGLVGALAFTVGAADSHQAHPDEDFKGPRIVMLHGGALPVPLFVTDFTEIAEVLFARHGPQASQEELQNRPVITVTLFWHNPTWEPFVLDPAKLMTLKPEDARETCIISRCSGRFYPAYGGKPALLFSDTDGNTGSSTATWRLSEEALAILRRIGVPTELR